MDYSNVKEFSEELCTRVSRCFPTYSTEVTEVLKNNSTTLRAMTIRKPESNLSPVFYLDPLYQTYLSGDTMDDIFERLCQTLERSKDEGLDISFLSSIDEVKDKVIFKLISKEKNKKMLQNVPHHEYLDFAIVFSIVVSSSEQESATAMVSNRLLENWGITESELLSLAMTNTQRLLPAQLNTMKDIVGELIYPDPAGCDFIEQDDSGMYVLSNQKKLFGASCILYTDLLKNLANQIDSDFYVLPSSLHEVILVPAKDNEELAKYSDLVQTVNQSAVQPEEILSDHAYYFSRTSGLQYENMKVA